MRGGCEGTRSLCPASVGASQPQGVTGVGGLGGDSLLQGFGSLLVVALHVVVAAHELVDRTVFGRDRQQDFKRMLEVRGIIEVPRLSQLRAGGAGSAGG